MEESPKGKLWEMQKMEAQDGYREVAGEFKTEPEAEADSARVISVNLNPQPVTETHNRDDSYKADFNECRTEQKVDSGELEEKIVKDSDVDSVEPEVHSPFAKLTEGEELLVEKEEAPDDVAVLESKVIEANISLSSVDKDSKVIEELIVPSSDANGGSSQGDTEVVSNAIEEIPLASSDEGMVRIASPSPDHDCEVPPAPPDVLSKAIDKTDLPALEKNPEESSATADLESREKVEEPSQAPANAGSVDNEPEIPATTENQPVTPLSRRSIQPTSWRSCCGLLQILHRSDR